MPSIAQEKEDTPNTGWTQGNRAYPLLSAGEAETLQREEYYKTAGQKQAGGFLKTDSINEYIIKFSVILFPYYLEESNLFHIFAPSKNDSDKD